MAARCDTGTGRDTGSRRPRWPNWVYGSGEEPDYRFSFANERTFLAWIRTALALIAAGIGLNAIELSLSPTLQRFLAAVLVALGVVCASASWARWARAERAIRRRESLRSGRLGVALSAVVTTVAVVIALAVVLT